MNQADVRDTLLSRISNAPKGDIPEKPEIMPFPEMTMDTDELFLTFKQRVEEQTGIVYRVTTHAELLEKLSHVFNDEGIRRIAVSNDKTVTETGIDTLTKESRITIKKPADFQKSQLFKDFLFNKADAGLTGADFAVAESGTLILVHNSDQPRLVSLAPVLHIAVVKLENLVPVYETAVDNIYQNDKPSQVTFITGPSMTADIQATPFKGMHGPKRLIVVVVDS